MMQDRIDYNNPYCELKAITDAVYAKERDKYAKDVIGVLNKCGIKLREKDGTLREVNISIPKSNKECILVGFRYIKKDRSFTEDHFLFEKGKPIKSFYKGKIESVLPEYKGAHKYQIRNTPVD